MADNDADKTEEPTSKRISDAREKGQVASSREVNNLFALAGATMLVLFLIPTLMADLQQVLVVFFDRPHLIMLTDGGLIRLIARIVTEVAAILFLPFLFLSVMAFFAGYIQNGLPFSAEPLKPNLNKLSLIKGAKRIFGPTALVEFVKSLFKFAIVGALVAAIVVPEITGIESMVNLPVQALPERIHEIVLMLVASVTGIMVVFALADYTYQKHKFLKGLRMTKQEVKDEHKQAEGDPEVKGRLKQIRRERSRRRMMAEVPTADVVVTNPTHFAVALKYEAMSMAAPRVVAKGADVLARRIRDLASEHDVPIVENPPLARALYATCELEQEVPEAHYRAVAEVISYVWKIKGKHAPATTR